MKKRVYQIPFHKISDMGLYGGSGRAWAFLSLFFLAWFGREKQGTAFCFLSEVDTMQIFVVTKARVARKFHPQKLSC